MEETRQGGGAREQILERIRAAVASAAPRKELSAEGPIFRPVANLLEVFQAECAANFVEVRVVPDQEQTKQVLNEVLGSLPSGEMFVQDAPALRALIGGIGGEHPVRWSSEGGPAEASQVTVTLCDALVAMTGSILVSSAGCGGRGSSVTAPCHVVIARAAQLLPDLESALARAREIAFDSSFIGLITGCSRTADIEKLLVIGAHGPKRVVVILQTGE